MAATTRALHERARALEEQFTELADSNASGHRLAAALQEYRDACDRLLAADFAYAAAHQIEQHLWSAHLRVNSVYRAENRKLKKHKELGVERRKLQKEYLQFIKSSQRYYRQHVLNLDVQIEGIPELRKIAFKWKDDAPRTLTRPRIDASFKEQVLRSCHQTLIQLGDLSRYRETELGGEKTRNWGPAKGYYELAADIYPDSGHSHNQLAVVAREDGNHFRVVYHLYRSLASKEPYPQAKQNLEVEFKRIVSAWEKGELIQKRSLSDNSSPNHALIAWFVRLHSKCYKGEDFKEHDELESEVLSHLAIELKEHSLDSVLQRIVLINLAAEYFASASVHMHVDSSPNVKRPHLYFLRLNVKTFFTLLQVLQPELERLSEGHDVTHSGDRAPHLSDKITVVARRVLPGLRLYSTWFARIWPVLGMDLPDTLLPEVDVKELWRSYADTLNLLASSFPVEELPRDNYMLEEDTDTIGFQPLMSPQTSKLWYDDNKLKQKWTDLERNHPNVEMLMRVRDMLVDGLVLATNKEAPLELENFHFVYREAGLPPLASPTHRAEASPVLSMETFEYPSFPTTVLVAEDQKSHSVAAPSETASMTLAKDNAMNQMVDDLVGPDDGLEPLPEEDENIPPTPPEQTFEDTALLSTNASRVVSINDYVHTVQNYKDTFRNYKVTSGSPAPAASLMATPMHRGASSSSIRGPANLPSLPDGQWNMNSIWNRSYGGTPGPASPLLPDTVDMRSSPMNGAASGHARGDSSNSFRSSDHGMTGLVRPVQANSGGLGSGTVWGNPATSHYGSLYGNGNASYGHGYSPNGHPSDVDLASPLLFRGSYAEQMHSSYGRTPPNGQAG